jgi:hypothetical protein
MKIVSLMCHTFFPNQVMYENDRHTSKKENKVLKMAMCVFQLGTEPFTLLSMLSSDVQVIGKNITAQNTTDSQLSVV